MLTAGAVDAADVLAVVFWLEARRIGALVKSAELRAAADEGGASWRPARRGQICLGSVSRLTSRAERRGDSRFQQTSSHFPPGVTARDCSHPVLRQSR